MSDYKPIPHEDFEPRHNCGDEAKEQEESSFAAPTGSATTPDNFDDYGDEERGYCDRCSNTGMVNCYCGGDLCVCYNFGEMPCPVCG